MKCCRVMSLSSSDSKSCSSSLERDVSFEEFGDWSMRIDIDDVVSETRRSDMKLKVILSLPVEFRFGLNGSTALFDLVLFCFT